MSKIDNLKLLLEKHNGIITTKQAEDNNIHRQYLKILVEQGELERVAHGVYITPDVWEDPMVIHQLRKSKMVYSHETALYLHDLTDRDPLHYVVTVPSGYNPTQLKKDGLIVHTIKKELFDLGLCFIETSFGHKVKTYNMERTICDIVNDRNNQDPAILNDALKRYLQSKGKNINLLMEYAKLLKVEKIIRIYLEVLL